MALTDTQSSFDSRNIDIPQVGIKDFRLPFQWRTRSGLQNTVGNISMYCYLPGRYKGTHMSRFIALMTRNIRPIDARSMRELTQELRDCLEAPEAEIYLEAPFFMEKRAPISGQKSLMDYLVAYHIQQAKDGASTQFLQVKVPVTSLCPCSKEISDFGAHNQRSLITIKAQYEGTLEPETLIEIAESEASCDLYSLLKRPDEKYVTERAYTQAKFVEDMARDLYRRLLVVKEIIHFTASSENFESIHNHSAFAKVKA